MDQHDHSSRTASLVALAVAGVLFLVVLVLAFANDDLTDFQQAILWVILALAAAAAAASIPGALKADFTPQANMAVSASGAIVVFLVVFFFVPSIIQNADTPDEDPTPTPTAMDAPTEDVGGTMPSPAASPAASPIATPLASPLASPVGSPVSSPQASPIA